jgi:hypothetical protein
MGNILKVVTKWTGLQGGNGFTNLYFEPVPEADAITQAHVDAAVARVENFFTAFRPYRPPAVFTQVDPAVQELDENSGQIRAFWGAVTAAPAAGTSVSGSHSAVAGACINWSTANALNGRRVRGRTFMVPLGASGLDVNGTIDNTALGVMRTAATTLQADGANIRLVVWHRPSILGIDGGAYDVISASINDKTAILTSRRD